MDPSPTDPNLPASPPLPVSTETLLASLLERSSEGIVVLRPERDAAGVVTDFAYILVNPAAARMLGRDPDGLVGRSLRREYPGTVETGIIDHYLATLATGVPYTQEFHYPYDGLSSWFRQVVTRLGDGLVITTTDLTDAKRVESLLSARTHALAEVERYKEEFLAVISHELRTPLNFITGFASILEDELQGPLNDEQRGSVGKVLEGADRLLDIVEGLLAYARLRAGALTLAPEPTAWASLVRGVVGQFAGKARAARVDLVVGALPDVVVPVDGARLRMVLWHLLDNAIKFTPAGGAVRVEVVVAGGRLRTSVVDTGRGIAPEAQAQLFERFHQLDMSSTRAAGGLGLGLALVHGLVSAHGGTVGVTSQVGQGASFWFEVAIPGN